MEMLFEDFSILALVAILFGGVNCVGNFGKGPYEEHLCKIILNLGQQFRWRCHLMIFLFLALVAILFGGMNCLGNFGKGLMRNGCVKLF